MRTLAILVAAVVVAIVVLACMDVLEAYVNAPSSETIFVSVPSYRDDSCMATLQDMFTKADNPKRVFAGCCEQNTDAAGEVCKPVGFAFHDQVRVVSIPHMEAKGPTYARALCAHLYRGEDYFLSIDAHSKFVKGWDTKLVSMVSRCPNPDKAIVSHYPPGLDDLGKPDPNAHVPRLCAARFGQHGLPILDAVALARVDTAEPVPFLAGGMWCARGRILEDVPMDPTLDFLFQGEEFLLAARCWTHGYDIYTPTENIVFHDYKREHAPRYWNDQPAWHAKQQATVARVRRMLHIDQPPLDDPKYGLGNARTIHAYYAFAGVDLKNKTIGSKAKFCPGV